MNPKIYKNIKDLLSECHPQNGISVSFHHHLRNGDYVLNYVLQELAELGIRDIRLHASALFDIHEPLLELIQNKTVSFISTNYMSAGIGKAISKGIMEKPVLFKTHGGRPSDILDGETQIDIAFIAAPAVDRTGNVSGKLGQSACGSLGYAMADAEKAAVKVAVTDHLLTDDFLIRNPEYISIPAKQIDYILEMDKIGDPQKIVSGTTKITRDPIGLLMAETATRIIEASGLLQNGFSFQTGAGGASLATAKYLADVMRARQISGSFAMGGITGYLVDMLEQGLFKDLYDVQCFDLKAIDSIRQNPHHHEISASTYASPTDPKALVNQLDVVILGATEIDTNFNVNVHTDSNGLIMGGSGGHSDTAAGAKLTMIIAPLIRARLPLIVDRVHTISTPGETVDVLVTQYGTAVNPLRQDLLARLADKKIPKLRSIADLQAEAIAICGQPASLSFGNKIVADVKYRDGKIIDHIPAVK